jgi:N-acetylneuraminic acid mutarotase
MSQLTSPAADAADRQGRLRIWDRLRRAVQEGTPFRAARSNCGPAGTDGRPQMGGYGARRRVFPAAAETTSAGFTGTAESRSRGSTMRSCVTRMARLMICACLALGIAGIWAVPAQAASLTVTDCTDDSGAGTLRAAVTQANSDPAGDTITFGCSGTITLQSPLSLTNPMTIDGSGQNVIIDGGGSVQLFTITGNGSATPTILNDLTLENGNATDGGAIENEGDFEVDITNTTLTGNSATDGGAIYNIDYGANPGAGATVQITNSTFSGNSATDGGAIYDTEDYMGFGQVFINDSTFSGNSASSDGGVIWNEGPTSYNPVLNTGADGINISASTFSGNSASSDGGVIYNNDGVPIGVGTATITNSTFSGNSASSDGGVIDNQGTASVTSSTFSGNSVTGNTEGAIIFNDNDSGKAGPTASIGGSIIANSTGTDCLNEGTLTDWGYNLEDVAQSTCGFSSAKNDILGTSPGFVLDSSGNPVLTNNGGPTQTIALSSASPAIDQIPVSYDISNPNPTPLCPSTDQRGSTRPDGGESACDMGAYESDYATNTQAAPTIVQQPQGYRGYANGPAVTLSVLTSGNPAPSYQWYSSTDGSTFSQISGATSPAYTVPVSTAGVTQYYVQASNAAGSADSNTVTVTLLPSLVWQSAPSLPEALTGQAFVTGADGTLYAIGGLDSGGDPVSTVYSFNPATGTQWQTAPSLPVPLADLAAAVGADGTIYAIGGLDSGGDPVSTVYSFNPATGTQWQTAPSLPVPLADLAATTGTDGTIYAMGGFGNDGTVSTVYSFNPATDTQWQTAPSLPVPLSYLVATTGSDGTIYAVGGLSSGAAASTVYSFKPRTDTQWQTAPSLPETSAVAAVTGTDGTLYAIGANQSSGNFVYSLKPGTDTQWLTAVSPLPAGDTGGPATAGSDGSIWVLGGSGAVYTTYSADYTLAVAKSGSGSGTVKSALPGITCGSTCSHSYNTGALVSLTAAPARGSTFTGWSGGGCSGTGTCTVTMSSAQTVTAAFSANTWTVNPGGAITAKAHPATMKDPTAGQSVTCASSTAAGSLESGSGLAATGIGTLTSITFTDCAVKGTNVTVTFSGTMPVNGLSYRAATHTASLAITHVHGTLSGTGCSATIDGTKATAHNGKVTAEFLNGTDKLKILASGGALHLYNVNCSGTFSNGDAVNFAASYKLSPEQTITSP